MVWGCSWSMKIAERSSAMSAAHQLAQLVEDHPPHVLAREGAVDRLRRRGHRGRLRARGPRLEAAEVAERLGGVLVVGEPRPLRQVARLEVVGQRRAAEEARPD